MTIFIQRASQQYTARPGNPYTVSGTIPSGKNVSQIQITMSRESWPVGPVLNITLTYPDGTQSGESCSGGDIVNPRTGLVAVNSIAAFYAGSEQQFYDPGTYTLAFEVLQTLTSAVTVEYF
jgi:hypothetical protein